MACAGNSMEASGAGVGKAKRRLGDETRDSTGQGPAARLRASAFFLSVDGSC